VKKNSNDAERKKGLGGKKGNFRETRLKACEKPLEQAAGKSITRSYIEQKGTKMDQKKG